MEGTRDPGLQSAHKGSGGLQQGGEGGRRGRKKCTVEMVTHCNEPFQLPSAFRQPVYTTGSAAALRPSEARVARACRACLAQWNCVSCGLRRCTIQQRCCRAQEAGLRCAGRHNKTVKIQILVTSGHTAHPWVENPGDLWQRLCPWSKGSDHDSTVVLLMDTTRRRAGVSTCFSKGHCGAGAPSGHVHRVFCTAGIIFSHRGDGEVRVDE